VADAAGSRAGAVVAVVVLLLAARAAPGAAAVADLPAALAGLLVDAAVRVAEAGPVQAGCSISSICST
jgi:hypothetical protein